MEGPKESVVVFLFSCSSLRVGGYWASRVNAAYQELVFVPYSVEGRWGQVLRSPALTLAQITAVIL